MPNQCKNFDSGSFNFIAFVSEFLIPQQNCVKNNAPMKILKLIKKKKASKTLTYLVIICECC